MQKLTVFLLSVALLANACITPSIANEIRDMMPSASETQQNPADTPAAPGNPSQRIIGEVVEKRKEYEKHFKLANGGYMAASYEVPVHFLDDSGSWQEYDNTMQQTPTQVLNEMTGFSDATQQAEPQEPEQRILPVNSLGDNGVDSRSNIVADGYFKNKKSDSTIVLSKFMKNKKAVYLEHQGFSITWGVEGAAKSPVEFINAKQDAQPVSSSVDDAQSNSRFLNLSGITQQALYKDVFENVDMQYIISPKSIKENIILRNANAKNSFVFEYNTNGLEAFQVDDKTIQLKDGANVVYTIVAPYMSDSAGQVSESLSLEILSVKNKKLRVALSADSAWLNATDREYPVTIDPEVVIKGESMVKTAYVKSASPNTNYSGGDYFYIGTNAQEKMRAFIDFTLPSLPSGSEIVGAYFSLCQDETYNQYEGYTQYNLHEVTQAWDVSGSSGVKWNTMPAYNSVITEVMISNGLYNTVTAFHEFDMTKLVRKWYTDSSSNYGVMIKSAKESTTGKNNVKIASEKFLTLPDTPHITVYYTNTIGIESHLSYHNQYIGKTSSYINDMTGQLTAVESMISLGGSRMPLNFNIVYNSANYGKVSAGKISLPIGFTTNFSMSIKRADYATSAQLDYILTDADGTEHNFVYTTHNTGVPAEKYYDEMDSNTFIYVYYSQDKIEVRNEINSSILEFKKSDGSFVKSTDANGNVIAVTGITNNKITEITDGAGRKATLSYNTTHGMLSKISYGKGNINLTYGQINGITQLTSISYPDGFTTVFDFASHMRLDMIKYLNKAGAVASSLKYSYNQFYKIVKVESYGAQETQGGVSTQKKGQTMGITYSDDLRTIFTTAGSNDLYENGANDDLKTTYCFDTVGRITSIYNNFGYSTAYSYSNNNDGSKNKVTSDTPTNKTSNNLLVNHNLEYTDAWAVSGTSNPTIALSSDKAYAGVKSAYLDKNSDFTVENYQSISLKGGKTYTLSAYMNTEGTGANSASGAYVFARVGANTYKSSVIKSPTMAPDEADSDPVPDDQNWDRLTVTFDVAQDSTIVVGLASKNMSKTVYFDAVQLEEGDGATSYNYLQNGSLDVVNASTQRPALWTSSSTLTAADKAMNFSPSSPADDKAMYFTGDFLTKKSIKQTIKVKGTDNDSFLLSARVRAAALANRGEVDFSVTAEVFFVGITETLTQKLTFNNLNTGTQYASLPIVFNHGDNNDGGIKIDKFIITLNFDHNVNYAYMDDISFVKSPSRAYRYDDDGNLLTVKESAEKNSSMQYNDQKLLSQAIDPKGYEYYYTYDNKQNMTSARSQTGVSNTFTYDAFGNTTGVRSNANDGSGKHLLSDMFYDGAYNGNYLTLTKNARQFTKTAAYNFQKDLLTEQKDFDDVYYTYAYTPSDMIASTTVHNLQSSYSITNAYDDNDNLVATRSGDSKYGFTYDTFGNVISTKAKNRVTNQEKTLVTNAYNNENGKLNKITYANGSTYTPVYDSFGRLGADQYGTSVLYEYKYNNAGEKSKIIDNATGGVVESDYDTTGRLTTTREKRENYLVTNKYFYDMKSNVSKYMLDQNGVKHTRSSVFGKDNLHQSTMLSNHTITVDLYDTLNRPSSTRLTSAVLGTALTKGYTYLAGDFTNSTTSLVDTMRRINYNKSGTVEDVTYGYTYAQNGDLRIVKKGDETVKEYYYDALHQLIRANEKGVGSFVYTYDETGNLLSKKKYAYTAGLAALTGTPSENVSYGYNDSVWNDLLTSVGGSEVTSDALGNILTYGEKDLTWSQGRKLDTVWNAGSVGMYTYDEAGLRTKKFSNGMTTHFFYGDGKLIAQKTTNPAGGVQDEIVYLYDGKGTLLGFSLGTKLYYYVTGLYGEIEGIIDANGDRVVTYQYDPWGKILSVTGTMAASVGQTNPIRYKGYYYDNESGYYYLQSRYYDPAIARFVSADLTVSTGQGVLGYNMYAYCNNNPVNLSANRTAPSSEQPAAAPVKKPVTSPFSAPEMATPDVSAFYSVPLYFQNGYSLCWAFCQAMVEDYQAGMTRTHEGATNRAIEIAKSLHGEQDWNKGGAPTNATGKLYDYELESIEDLARSLRDHGPIYAHYTMQSDTGYVGHAVVVTGVDITRGVVYTNNPWNIAGEQTFDEFMQGFIEMDVPGYLRYCSFV